MAPPRKLKGPSAAAGAYPTGAVLLGVLRDVLNIPLGDGTARTSARVAAGEVVDERSVIELCRSIASAIVEKLIEPLVSRDQVSLGLYILLKKWDVATAPLRVGEPQPLDQAMMTMAAAQLFVVELGARGGALLALTSSPMLAHAPLKTSAEIMTDMIESTGVSQGQLALTLKIAETTLVRWKRGEARPSEQQLSDIASKTGTPKIHGVRRSLAFIAIRERLETILPASLVADLWERLNRICNDSRKSLSARSRDEVERALVFGVEAIPDLIEQLSKGLGESDGNWRAPIDSAGSWGARLEFVRAISRRMAASTLPFEVSEVLYCVAATESISAVARITDELSRVLPDLEAQLSASRLLFEGAVALRQGRSRDAARSFEDAHARLPDDPRVTRAVIDGLLRSGQPVAAILKTTCTAEGTAEARRIRALASLGSGHVETGLTELEALLREGDTHPEMHIYVGVARFVARNFAEALAALECALADERFANHFLALDIAAACAFELGKHKRGEELARRANQVGVSRSYLWKHGTRS